MILDDQYEDAIKTLSAMKEEVDDKDFQGHVGFGKDSHDPEDYD